MSPLFDTAPIRGLKPDGRIERRGRPKLRDEKGHELCTLCKHRFDREGEIKEAREKVLNELKDELLTQLGFITEFPSMAAGDANTICTVLLKIDSLLSSSPKDPTQPK